MRQRERVAELRRQLPEDAIVKDTIEEGPASLDEGDTPTGTIRMSELFTGPDRAVVMMCAEEKDQAHTLEVGMVADSPLPHFRNSRRSNSVCR